MVSSVCLSWGYARCIRFLIAPESIAYKQSIQHCIKLSTDYWQKILICAERSNKKLKKDTWESRYMSRLLGDCVIFR